MSHRACNLLDSGPQLTRFGANSRRGNSTRAGCDDLPQSLPRRAAASRSHCPLHDVRKRAYQLAPPMSGGGNAKMSFWRGFGQEDAEPNGFSVVTGGNSRPKSNPYQQPPRFSASSRCVCVHCASRLADLKPINGKRSIPRCKCVNTAGKDITGSNTDGSRRRIIEVGVQA